jgi:hypothetical protein
MKVVKNLKAIFVIHFLVFYSIVNAQNNTTDSIKKIGYEDTKIFKSTSPDFVSLKMQSHKGLLRFGRLNSYILGADGKEKDSETYKIERGEEKQYEAFASLKVFEQLLVLKHLSENFKDIDKNRFTQRTSSMYVADKNSYLAQTHLLKLASVSAGAKIVKEYFCNDKKEDCEKMVASYQFGNSYGYKWGGKEANEFRKLNTYKSYVSKYLEPLQQWSTELIKNDQVKAYYVAAIKLGTYDFDNEGYWLDRRRSLGPNSFLNFSNFDPVKVENRKLANLRKPNILYKIPPDEAEKFREKFNTVYIVFQINITIKGLDYSKERVFKRFNIEGSVMNIYTDEALTQQIAELLIENLELK